VFFGATIFTESDEPKCAGIRVRQNSDEFPESQPPRRHRDPIEVAVNVTPAGDSEHS